MRKGKSPFRGHQYFYEKLGEFLCFILVWSIAVYPVTAKSSAMPVDSIKIMLDALQSMKKNGIPAEIELQEEFNSFRYMDDLYDFLIQPSNRHIIETMKITPIGERKILLTYKSEKILIESVDLEKRSLVINGQTIVLAEYSSLQQLKAGLIPTTGFNFLIPKAHAFFARLVMGLLAVFALPKIFGGLCKNKITRGLFAANCGGSSESKKKECSKLNVIRNFVKDCLGDGMKSSADQRYYSRKGRAKVIGKYVRNGSVSSCKGKKSTRSGLKSKRRENKSKMRSCFNRIPTSGKGKGGEAVQ